MTAKHAILSADAHRDLRIRTDRGAELGDGVMASMVVPREFRDVQQHYPILFRLNAERDNFTPVALMGFEAGENLFLEDGRWDADYVPLAIDIQPFLIGGADGEGERQVHIDLASPRISHDEGTRVFEPEGTPSPLLEAVVQKLGTLDAGYRETAAFIEALRQHRLLEPLALEITLADGSANRLVGFHIVNEAALRGLDAAALGELHAAGHLMPIFMAVAALGNVRGLIARKNKRSLHG